MFRKTKQVFASSLAMLIVIANFFVGAPSVTANPLQPGAAYAGIDKTTKGQWNGKYGRDGYILFGYGATAHATDMIEVEKYTYDAVQKPEYVDPINGHAYSLNDGSRIKVRPLPADPLQLSNILDIPAGSGLSNKAEAAVEIGDNAPPLIINGTPSNNGGRRTFTFQLNDNQEHLFTVYSTKSLTYKYFGIQDLNGNDLLPLTRGGEWFGDNGDNSTYVSFRVKGSFKLNYDGQWENIGLQGVFFDAYCPIGITAQPQPDSTVALSWTNRPGADHVLVERSGNGTDYNRIASLSGTAVNYIDNDSSLAAGQVYHYRLQYETGGVASVYTTSVSVTVPAYANVEEPRVFLGTDSSTSGLWHNKYGSDGYILVGYDTSVVPKVQEWSSLSAIPANDLAQKPSYLDSYAYETESQLVLPPLSDSDRYYGYVIEMPPGAAVPANPDEVTAGQPRKKYKAYARMNRETGAYTFHLNDDKEHVFSLYSRQVESITFQLQDLSGQVIAQQPVNQEVFQNGGYVSFLVKGSFKLFINTPSQDFGGAAFFFDSPLPDQPADLTADLLPQRKALIKWTHAGTPDKVILERKKGSGKYSQISTLSPSITEYTDTNLMSGSEYSYRVRNVKGSKYGSATAPKVVTVPAMTPTTLTLQNTEDIHTSVGGSVSVNSVLQVINQGTASALAGKTVTFRLQGDNVGDGVTFGQEIPEVIGSAVTDADGKAGITFNAEYAGSYKLIATTEPDDADNLEAAASAPLNLTVDRHEDHAAPVILKISDAVKAGKLFTINGYGLDEPAVDIAMERDSSGSAPAAPPSGAIHPEVVQKDRSGFFVVAKMPAGAEPGVYNIWVKNNTGWSAVYKMNMARPLFISDYEAYNGIDIQIAGRNFDQAEFGGHTQTKVRLNDGAGKTFNTTVKTLNPYGLSFTVGEADLGRYFVEVSNDNGNNWSRLVNGQTLTIVAPGKDPLGLGVAWARDFNWDHQINVTDYGANPADQVDDTAQVQAAVDAAAAEGGVVIFPNGSYYIQTINLPSGVVLLGEDTNQTKLYYTGLNKNFIDSTAYNGGTGVPERQGVAKLSLLLSDPNKRPDSFMWLGEGWGASVGDVKLRKANRLFVTDVKIDYPTDTDREAGSGRGIGIEFIAKERMLVKNNHFVGWHAQPFITFVNEYYTLKNNDFEFTEGFVVGVSTYAFYENNHVKAVNPDAHKETHGLFARSNAYIVDNIVENMGDTSNNFNDGEAIAMEIPNGVFNYGKVLKAGPTSITVAPVKPLVNPTLEYGYLSVLITDGKGMGQTRKVKDIDKYTINLYEPFDITPDSSSKFTLIAPNDNATVYNNTIKNNAKGIWLFGNAIDSVVADNKSIDSEGIFVYSVRNNQGLSPDYYTRITGNEVTGISRRSDHGGIGFNTGRGDNNRYYSVDVYATEILNNKVTGNNAIPPTGGKTEAPPFGGIYASSATHSSGFDGVMGTGDSTNTVIEGNVLSDLKTGVDLTHASYGQIVQGNRYDSSVLAFINDTGSVNTIVQDNSLNHAPLLEVIGSKTVDEGAKLKFTVNAADPDSVDKLTYRATGLPPGAEFNNATREFSWTPGYTQSGTYTVHFEVSDGILTDEEDVTITVNDVPPPGVVEVLVTLDSNQKGIVQVSAAALNRAIQTSPNKQIQIHVLGADSAKGITVEMPLQPLDKADLRGIEVQAGLAVFKFTPQEGEALRKTASKLQLAVTLVDPASLSKEMRKKVGDAAVYDFRVSIDGTTIRDLEGKVGIEIYYTLKAGENPQKVVIYYFNEKGKLVMARNGVYDSGTGKVRFKVQTSD